MAFHNFKVSSTVNNKLRAGAGRRTRCHRPTLAEWPNPQPPTNGFCESGERTGAIKTKDIEAKGPPGSVALQPVGAHGQHGRAGAWRTGMHDLPCLSASLSVEEGETTAGKPQQCYSLRKDRLAIRENSKSLIPGKFDKTHSPLKKFPGWKLSSPSARLFFVGFFVCYLCVCASNTGSSQKSRLNQFLSEVQEVRDLSSHSVRTLGKATGEEMVGYGQDGCPQIPTRFRIHSYVLLPRRAMSNERELDFGSRKGQTFLGVRSARGMVCLTTRSRASEEGHRAAGASWTEWLLGFFPSLSQAVLGGILGSSTPCKLPLLTTPGTTRGKCAGHRDQPQSGSH